MPHFIDIHNSKMRWISYLHHQSERTDVLFPGPHAVCQGKIHSLLVPSLLLTRSILEVSFCILYKNKVRRVTGRWRVVGVKDTAYISWSWIMHHLHGQTWKHRKGKRGRISRLSSTRVSVHRLWPGTNLFWTTIPPLSWEVLFSQVCFFFFNHLSPNP